MTPVIYAAALLSDLGQEITEDKLDAVLEAAGCAPQKYKAQIKVLLGSRIDIKAEIERIRTTRPSVVVQTPVKIETPQETPKEQTREDADQFGFDKLFGN